MAAHSNIDGVEKIFNEETQQWADVEPDTSTPDTEPAQEAPEDAVIPVGTSGYVTTPDAEEPVVTEVTTSVTPAEPAVEDPDRDIKVLAAFELIHGKYGRYDNETYVKLTDDGFDPEEIFAIRLAILNGQPY